VPYDGVDQDCDGADLTDQDGDGWDGGSGLDAEDCDDADPEVHPGAVDACYDGVDADCATNNDDDCDGDGQVAVEAGGQDCDDADDRVRPGAEDVCHDGVDSDCAGNDDDDCDGDGQRPLDYGGTDCDDLDPAVYAGGEETWADLASDNDCDGSLADPVATPLSEIAAVLAPPGAGGRFGNSVGTLPDVDGDGRSEVWISAPYQAGSAPNLGALYVLESAALEPGVDVTTDGPALLGVAEGDLLGTSVATGDSDGQRSLYVSSIGASGNAGAVYELPASGLDAGAERAPSVGAVRSFVGEAGDYVGTRVVADRDFDGDGLDDVLLEAPGARKVALFSGGGSGTVTLTDADVAWTADVGRWLNTSGLDDVDGDGVDDVGVVQGNTPTATVGSALFRGGAALAGGAFPEGAYVGFVDAPSFGAFTETPWGERVLLMVQWQVSAFVGVTEGATYDALSDADWAVFRDSEEGGFSDVLPIYLGSVGWSFLLTAPYSPADGLTGTCVVWSSEDWRGDVFARDLPLAVVGDQPGDRGCRSVVPLEDEDGDGASDLLVGADGAGPDEQGRAYLLLAP